MLTDEQAAALIAADKIDILVDLALHTANGRPLLFARNAGEGDLAGYPGTTGLTTMDYRITDVHLDPPGLNDEYYFEESIRLPETMWCYAPLPDSPPVNSLPAVSTGRITFGCLNNFSKVNRKVIEMWAAVLAAVRVANVIARADRRIATTIARYVWASWRRRRPGRNYQTAGVGGFLALYHRIDIALDTFHGMGIR